MSRSTNREVIMKGLFLSLVFIVGCCDQFEEEIFDTGSKSFEEFEDTESERRGIILSGGECSGEEAVDTESETASVSTDRDRTSETVPTERPTEVEIVDTEVDTDTETVDTGEECYMYEDTDTYEIQHYAECGDVEGVYCDNNRLRWQQTSKKLLPFEAAREYCNNLDLAGLNWRMPTIEELVSVWMFEEQDGCQVGTTGQCICYWPEELSGVFYCDGHVGTWSNTLVDDECGAHYVVNYRGPNDGEWTDVQDVQDDKLGFVRCVAEEFGDY